MNADHSSERIIDLPIVARSISLSPDEQTLVLGQARGISLLDLSSNQVINTLTLPFAVHNTMMLNNDWIYARGDIGNAAVNIRSGEINNFENGILGNIEGTLNPHPGQSQFFGSTGIKIRDDISRAMYGILLEGDDAQFFTPLRGRNSVVDCEGNWPSPDGTLLITACGTVFPIDGNLTDNFAQLGVLEFQPWLRSLAYSPNGNVIVGITRNDGWIDIKEQGSQTNQWADNLVVVWDATTFQLRQVFVLPDFDAPISATRGQYVFVNDEGTRFYVIVVEANRRSDAPRYGLIAGDL